MKKILTISLIFLNIILVPTTFGATQDDPTCTTGSADCCNKIKTYETPADTFDSEISEPLTGENTTMTLSTDSEGLINAYRNTYTCTYTVSGSTAPVSSTTTVIEDKSCQNKSVTCTTSTAIQILRAKSGVGLIMQYISAIYKWGASLAGMVAVVIIIWSGIQISTSQGKDIEAAKNRIIQSLSGLALLFLSGLLLYTINPTFFTAS